MKKAKVVNVPKKIEELKALYMATIKAGEGSLTLMDSPLPPGLIIMDSPLPPG